MFRSRLPLIGGLLEEMAFILVWASILTDGIAFSKMSIPVYVSLKQENSFFFTPSPIYFIATIILMDLQYYLLVILICISLIINNKEYFSIWLFTSLERCMLKPSTQMWLYLLFVITFCYCFLLLLYELLL